MITSRLASIHELDDDSAKLYGDILLARLPAFTRQLLESQMKGYEYQSDFARTYYGQGLDEGREEGREEGMRRAVLALAAAKIESLSDELVNRINQLRDLNALSSLIVSLGQARDEAEALAALDAPSRSPS